MTTFPVAMVPNFNTNTPSDRLPWGTLTDGLQGKPSAWKKVNDILYWLQVRSTYYYIKVYPENEHGTELLLEISSVWEDKAKLNVLKIGVE